MQQDENRAHRYGRSWFPYQRHINLLLIGLIFLSLSLNIWTFVVIARTRSFAREQISRLASAVEESKSEVIALQVPIEQSVPIRVAVPLKQRLEIPIQVEVPINGEVRIPLETPFGEYLVPVPVSATVPISTTVPVTVSETVGINTSTDINMQLPVVLPITGTVIERYLEDIRQELVKLSREL